MVFPMAPQASPLQTRFTAEENGFLERFRVLNLVLFNDDTLKGDLTKRKTS